MPADRHFLYRSADDVFYAFNFDGTAVTDDNQNVATVAANIAITAAAASATRIFAFDNANDIVRVWDTDWNRQSSEEFTPRSTTYRAMACSDTHLIMINASETAEYYNLSDLSADTTKDQALGTGRVQGATVAGGFLYTLDDTNNLIEKRNLDGTQLSPRVTVSPPDLTRRCMISTKTTVLPVNRDTGLAVQYDLNLSRLRSITFGSSNSWFAGLTTFAGEAPPAVPGATTIATVLGQTTINVTLTEADANRSPILRYEYRYAAGTTVPDATTWTPSGLTPTIENLQASTQYTIEARAVNAIGEGPIASATVTTLAPATVPDAVTISEVLTTFSTFMVQFVPGAANRSPITRFEYRYGETIAPTAQWTALAADATEFTVSGLNPETDYDVELRAVNAVGAGPSVRRSLRTDAAPPPVSIESIDEQFIAIGTKNYELIIDITGEPDSVDVKGHMEGFFSDWDSARGQLRIKADEVTRLIEGVTWDLKVIRDTETLIPKIKYNVIPAAPIFETLPLLHLYRGVPINVEIVIQNIPSLLIPNARLIGLKSTLEAYGINIAGEIPTDATFSFNTGNATILIPSETGETSDMHNYPYIIEAGSPPQIGDVTFTPQGRYGEIAFGDLNPDHALGFEWTLSEGDDAWNFFSETRNVINPGEVEITPGHLNVTIKFPNIAAAASYEYQLVSETSETPWIPFVGTLENNMITTIIPDLEDGVEYTLRLRVASPWVGAPISVKVYGGRLAYTIHQMLGGGLRPTGDNMLYLFHTGVANGGSATRIKRVLLPTTFTTPGGLAVDADRNVYILNMVDRAEKALYVFNASVIDGANDGDRIAPSKKNPLPADIGGSSDGRGIAVYNNELYMLLAGTAVGTGVFRNGRTIASLSDANGQTLTGLRYTQLAPPRSTARNPYLDGLSVTDNYMFVMYSGQQRSPARVDLYERDSGVDLTLIFQSYGLFDASANTFSRDDIKGLKVIDDIFYAINDSNRDADLELIRFAFNSGTGRYEQEWFMNLPIGLSQPRFLDML